MLLEGKDFYLDKFNENYHKIFNVDEIAFFKS